MKKEWLLLASASIVTLLIGLGVIRLLAPQLLGVPVDLRIVKVSKEVPAFYENIWTNRYFRLSKQKYPQYHRHRHH